MVRKLVKYPIPIGAFQLAIFLEVAIGEHLNPLRKKKEMKEKKVSIIPLPIIAADTVRRRIANFVLVIMIFLIFKFFFLLLI